MTEIRFYHLQRSTLRDTLPQLLDKAIKGGRRVVVRVADDATAEKLAADLWTYHPDSFLPHGTKADGNPNQQPIWITAQTDTPNGADMLVLCAKGKSDGFENFTLVCDVFDGTNDQERDAARARWATFKDAGHALTYWQQTDTGWEKKADTAKPATP